MSTTGSTVGVEPDMKLAPWSANTTAIPTVTVVSRPPARNQTRILTG
jgi:hypothetical protein